MSRVKVIYDVHSKTYAAIGNVAWHLLDISKQSEKGRLLNLQAATVFLAFTFEAYLNHVGSEEIKFWDEIERISHKQKLRVLAKFLGFDADASKDPFQTVHRLFALRDSLAHGRTIKETITKEVEEPLPLAHAWRVLPKEELTLESVERYYKEVHAAIAKINESRPHPEDKFDLLSEGGRGYEIQSKTPQSKRPSIHEADNRAKE